MCTYKSQNRKTFNKLIYNFNYLNKHKKFKTLNSHMHRDFLKQKLSKDQCKER